MAGDMGTRLAILKEIASVGGKHAPGTAPPSSGEGRISSLGRGSGVCVAAAARRLETEGTRRRRVTVVGFVKRATGSSAGGGTDPFPTLW